MQFDNLKLFFWIPEIQTKLANSIKTFPWATQRSVNRNIKHTQLKQLILKRRAYTTRKFIFPPVASVRFIREWEGTSEVDSDFANRKVDLNGDIRWWCYYTSHSRDLFIWRIIWVIPENVYLLARKMIKSKINLKPLKYPSFNFSTSVAVLISYRPQVVENGEEIFQYFIYC